MGTGGGQVARLQAGFEYAGEELLAAFLPASSGDGDRGRWPVALGRDHHPAVRRPAGARVLRLPSLLPPSGRPPCGCACSSQATACRAGRTRDPDRPEHRGAGRGRADRCPDLRRPVRAGRRAAPRHPARHPAPDRPIRRRLPVRAVYAPPGGVRLPGADDGPHQRARRRRLLPVVAPGGVVPRHGSRSARRIQPGTT